MLQDDLGGEAAHVAPPPALLLGARLLQVRKVADLRDVKVPRDDLVDAPAEIPNRRPVSQRPRADLRRIFSLAERVSRRRGAAAGTRARSATTRLKGDDSRRRGVFSKAPRDYSRTPAAGTCGRRPVSRPYRC